MAKATAVNPSPPFEVLVEFLHALEETVTTGDQIVPVLRGSALMKRWFAAAARPAGDIDLEWFPHPDRRDRAEVLLEHARRLCMCAVSDHRGSPIEFDDSIPVPNDGVNLGLWDYSTPGVRCYTGWRWAERNLSGVLQIDIAQAGSYDLASVAAEPIEFPREGGDPVSVLAYTPELLLAAKLSWIVRQVQCSRTAEGNGSFTLRGEPKDLFDAHLLLTEGRLRPEVFQDAFLAVAIEDKLDWNQMDSLFGQEFARSVVAGFPTWTDFFDRHEAFIHQSPAEMLRIVIARVRLLLGDVLRHFPFLRSIQDDPANEANFLIYADWLEERADPRAEFLRLFCRYFFHEDRSARAIVASSFSAQPGAWLCNVLGGPERWRSLRKRIKSQDDATEQRPGSRANSASSRPWWRFW